VLDAMAAGLPVVATRVGGVPEIVKDGETGLLVPPHDPEALAHAMARLADDSGMRDRLGSNGRSLARSFDADRTASRTRELYLEVLGEGTPATPAGPP
jgi:glycosyltransferase involved in cell wall biosynthesis